MGRPANGEVRSTPRSCVVCSKPFRAKFSNRYGKYCSRKCCDLERRPQVGEARPCTKCQQTIIVTALMVKRAEYICTNCRTNLQWRNAAYQRAYRQRNLETARRKEKAYRDAHPELFRRATQEWTRRNPDRVKAIQLRRKLRKRGLTEADYQRMLVEQDHRCAICLQPPPSHKTKNKALAVDHCHQTGINRGLLCFACNAILGNANDKIEILERAIAYLQRHRQAVAS